MSSFGGIVIHREVDEQNEFHVVDHRDLRSLYFDHNSIQSRIYRSDPGKLVLEYTRAMLVPLLFINPQRVLLLGLGGGALVNYLHQHHDCSIDVVERNARVIELAQNYFMLPQSERLTLHHADADQFLRHHKALYDLILVDLFTASGPASLLRQKGFYQRCYKHLDSQGMMSINLWREQEDGLPEAIPLLEKTLRRAVLSLPLREDPENIIALLGGDDLDFGSQNTGLKQRAKTLQQTRGLTLSSFLPEILKYL